MDGAREAPPFDLAGFLDRLARLAERDHRWLAAKVADAREWQKMDAQHERQAGRLNRAEVKARLELDELTLERRSVDGLLRDLETIARRAREERHKLLAEKAG